MMKGTSIVSVIKTSPQTVLQDYRRAMELAEYWRFISKDIRTILKLNLSWSLYYPACSTAPWQLEGVIKTLRENGYDNLVAMENRTVVTDIWKGLDANRWRPLLERYNVPFLPLIEAEWIRFHAKADTPAIDEIFGETHRIPKEFIGCNILHLPTIKTHGHTTMTGAMKNAFGGLITERRHHCHRLIHEILVDLLTIQQEIHPGIFAVTDGAVCGDGKGPRTMIPVRGDLILAGHDQVAVDAVSAKLMGFDPMDIEFLRLAHDRGLGCADVAQIDIVGDNVKDINLHFQTGRSPVIFGDQLFRKGSFRFMEPLVFHTPLFWFAIKSSWFYHDILWYNLIGKGRIRRFLKTDWGRLFEKY